MKPDLNILQFGQGLALDVEVVSLDGGSQLLDDWILLVLPP
jgi:hypothetical protein